MSGFNLYSKLLTAYVSRITLVLLLLLMVLLADAKNTIRVGIYQNDPKVFIDKSGTPKGILVDIMNEIAIREGWKIQYVFGTWSENIKRLDSFEIDILLDVSYSEERAKRFTLNKVFVIDDWLEVFTTSEQPLESVLKLEGKRLAVLEGSIQEQFMERDVKKEFNIDFTVVPFPDYPKAVESLRNGDTDVIVASRFFYFSKERTQDIWPTSIILRPSFTFFAFPKHQSKTLISTIDNQLMDMKNDAESVYYKSIKEWIKPRINPYGTFLRWAVILIVSVIVAAGVFIVILRHEIKVRTEKLQLSNQNIKNINSELENVIYEYQKVEKELTKFRFMVENARQEIFLAKPKGELVYVNNATCNSLGYSAAELLNGGIKLFDSIYGKKPEELFNALKQGELPAYETTHFTKGGRKLHKLVKSFYIEISDEGFSCHFAEDITSQKKATKALQESQMLFQTLAKMSPVGIFRTRADGYTTYVNPKWCELSGISLEHAQGDSWINAVHPDDREIVLNQWKERSSKGLPSNAEYRFVHEDDSIVWVLGHALPEKNGNEIIGFIGTITDITSQKQTELLLGQKAQEIKLQSDRYLELLNLATDAFFHGDSKGNLIMVNKAACELTGYSSEELLSMNLKELFSSNEINHKPLRYDLLEQGIILKNERQIKTKTGDYSYVEMNSKKMPDGTYQSFFRNITERKNTELLLQQKADEIAAQNEEYRQLNTELTKAKAKAEESDKLKSAFLANMSHEIRTPMNAICGFSRLLDRNNLDEGKRRDYIDIINTNSQQLLGIINDIVDISKIESGLVTLSTSEFDIADMISNIVKTLTPTLPSDEVVLSFSNGIPSSQSKIIGDETKARQVLTNLVVNAIKFTAKGSIIVRCRLIDEKYLEFEVKDTGIGIPEESVEKVFERFHQVEGASNESRKGTGLGLAISKGFVELMGGKIWAQSKLGQGSSFFFTLPYHPASNPEAKPHKTIVEATDKVWKDKTILIAEDDEPTLFYLTEVLASSGANIVCVSNGQDAVEKCKSGNKVDIVLMDIKLPILDGFEATVQIRKFNKTLPIIAQTAYAFPSDHQKAKEVGCDAFITKPIDREVLIETIKQLLG
ncbi:MAG: PAS domain S-box protein [Tenuifilaceae bacterium]|jgi:PAS domain S-box-containing protein|nr:PAS domain S-box protein [Tenuifilaceae bacterium]